MIAAGRRNDGSLRHTSVLLAVLVALPRADGALAAADRQLRGQQMASGGAPVRADSNGRGAGGDQSAAAVARAAQQIPGDVTIARALVTVRMQSDSAVQTSALLSSFGLRTTQDLQLLGGGPEASELMEGIRDKLSVGDRAKLRLLVGDHAHLDRIVQGEKTPVLSRAHRESGHRPAVSNKHRTSLRLLQDRAAGDGLSLDTIAIAVSVLIGAAGYVLQAYTSRRAERTQQQQDHANQVAEVRRQREHEQMLSQIKRTDRWLDDCANSIIPENGCLLWSRASFIGEMVPEIEANHLEELGVTLAGLMPMFPRDEDGVVTAARSGRVVWRPFEPTLMRVFGDMYHSFPSANAQAMVSGFLYNTLSQPFSADLPQIFYDLVNAAPTSSIAASYRHFACTVHVPACQRLATILRRHVSVVEWPSAEWLGQKFPHVDWSVIPTNIFDFIFRAYTAAWERILAEWNAGVFIDAQPSLASPVNGLYQCIEWSSNRGRAKQADLIGMTANSEVNMDGLINVLDIATKAASNMEGKDGK